MPKTKEAITAKEAMRETMRRWALDEMRAIEKAFGDWAKGPGKVNNDRVNDHHISLLNARHDFVLARCAHYGVTL